MPELPADDHAFVQTHAASQRLSRWIPPLALLVALVAVAVAIWSLLSGGSTSTSASAADGGNPNLHGDSKARACSAFNTVSNAVQLQTHADLGPDPVALTAVAGNARLALLGGGVYLLNNLDPNTPADLAKAVRGFAYDLQDIGINALAGEKNTDADQAARLVRGDETRKHIIELCK